MMTKQSSRRASSSDRAAEAQAIREDAARLWRMNVAGIWRVSGRTYASNEYQYLMHLHQSRDDDEEHNHPADFPLTYITGNDVSHDPDKEGSLRHNSNCITAHNKTTFWLDFWHKFRFRCRIL